MGAASAKDSWFTNANDAVVRTCTESSSFGSMMNPIMADRERNRVPITMPTRTSRCSDRDCFDISAMNMAVAATIMMKAFPTNKAGAGIRFSVAAPSARVPAVSVSAYIESKPITPGKRMRFWVIAWNTTVEVASATATVRSAPRRTRRSGPIMLQKPMAP